MRATRYPPAAWHESPNASAGVERPPRGAVLHTAEGTYLGTISWQLNPKSGISSYFIVGLAGEVAQMVALDRKAWTQGTGNAAWVGIECAGWGGKGEALTPAQVTAVADILVWLHLEWQVPLQLAESPTGTGLGWHGMGGAAWGGHYGCPGDAIKAQRPAILEAARAKLTTTSQPTDPEDQDMQRIVQCSNGDPMVLITNSIHSRWVQDEAELKDLVALYGPVQTWAPRDFYRPVLVGPAPQVPFAGRPAGWPSR